MAISPDTLRVLPLFSDLSPEDAAALLHNSKVIHCKRGQILFIRGDKVTHFFAVCTGTVQLFRDTLNGHEVTSDILIAGDTINCDEVLSGQSTHTANARAVEGCSLLEVPIAWMREHLSDFDHMGEKLMSSITDQLHRLQLEAEQQSSMSVPQIVACYLQKLCVLYNFDPRGFDLPYTKSLIASRLRIERETFSRALPRLREWGITVAGSHVSIMDIRKADDFVCSECSMSDECHTHLALHGRLDKFSKG